MRTFLKQIINLLKIYLLGLFLFSVLRLVYLIRFGEADIFKNYSTDLLSAFITGVRFDTQILCYAISLIFILNFFLFIPHQQLQKKIVAFSSVYSCIILSLLVFILFIDHQFYTYFQTHLNSLAFGFLEDDTTAVMASVWSDHPLIWLLLIIAFTCFVIYKLVKQIYATPLALSKAVNPFVFAGFFVCTIVLFGLGIRGSFGVLTEL